MVNNSKNWKSEKGQIWVETVIYTLVALVLIGLVLAFVNPKIEEIKDKSIIEQSISVMENLDSILNSLQQGGQGNKRFLELGVRKGIFTIDGVNEKIIFEIESEYEYSEPGEFINYNSLNVSTQKIGKSNKVTLVREYKGRYNITYQNVDEQKTFSQSPIPYKLFISNKGGSPTIVNFETG